MTKSKYYSEERPEIVAHVPLNIKTILDIGCSQGTFLKSVKEHTGAETWGIEFIAEAAEQAKFQVEDVIPSLPDGYFDIITLNDVLEHLTEPSEILKIIKTKLSGKGIIIASIPSVRYFSNLFELIVKKDWEYKDDGILDSTHLRFYTKKSMKRIFEKADYVVIKQSGINKIPSWKFKLFQLLTLGIFNDTKYLQYVCIAKPN
jgi:SAM-dependent methyltransferase